MWSKLDSLQSSFSKKKNDTRGADVSDRAQEGLILFPGPTSLSFSILSPSPSLTHISRVVHVFHKTVLVRGVSTQPENKSLFPSFLFLVVLN